MTDATTALQSASRFERRNSMNAKMTQGIMLIFLIFLCLNIAQGAEEKGEKTMKKDNLSLQTVKRYDVETAQVEYEIKGDFAHGRKTLLFSDWGIHQSDIEQQEGAITKSITIIDANFSYAFGTRDKDGYKSKIDQPAWRSDSGLDYSKWMAKIFMAQGFESSGARVIAGKTCDVWKHVTNPITICTWKGLPLSLESFTPDKKQQSITEAVKVDEHPIIAKDAFVIPADIKFKEE